MKVFRATTRVFWVSRQFQDLSTIEVTDDGGQEVDAVVSTLNGAIE